jgi:hypothetical protein
VTDANTRYCPALKFRVRRPVAVVVIVETAPVVTEVLYPTMLLVIVGSVVYESLEGFLLVMLPLNTASPAAFKVSDC